MDLFDWTLLPSEILAEIFHHIPAEYLIYDISAVCRSWRIVLQQMSFWCKRLSQEGIKISRELRLDLVNDIDHHTTLQLLKTVCSNSKTLPTFMEHHLSNYQDLINNHRYWDINGGDKKSDIRVASVFLMLRTPKYIKICINNKSSKVKDLNLFLLLLSHTKCQVTLHDTSAWEFSKLSTSTSDDILKYMTSKNVIYREFFGCVESVDILPKSLVFLWLSIQLDKSGKALDPGLERLNFVLPNLKVLKIQARKGTDISNMRNIMRKCNKIITLYMVDR